MANTSDYFRPQTKQTPEIDFRFSVHTLSLKGESFPENAVMFYGDVLDHVRDYLSPLDGTNVIVDVNLTYFNSTSTKLIFKLFSEFNQACDRGNFVTVNWHFDEDDDTLRDFGEEIALEYTGLVVNLSALTSP